jgi:predicted O-linked N-acetylglucosamine transferase (SPINDLY family)
VLAIDSSPQQQLRCAQAYAADKFPAGMALPVIPAPVEAPARLRLAYFSADFHDHATAHLIAEVFERHDRSRFELIAFSFGPRRDDPWRRRLVAAFDRFEEVGDLTDREIALRARRWACMSPST